MIIHHVASSRPLKEKRGKFTYIRSLFSPKKVDTAYPYLNFGKYVVNGNDIDVPSFAGNGSPESDHFINIPAGFHLPAGETTAFFTEIFTELKQKGDKVLYLYLFGFGNNVRSEMNKQLEPFHRYYVRDEWQLGSPVGKLVLLSWPSQGKLEYKNFEEEADVKKMGRSLAVLFVKMYHFIHDPANPLFADWKPRLVFHAQSMGNRILKVMAKEISDLEDQSKINNQLLDNFFFRMVMTGADLPEDAIEEDNPKPEAIHRFAERVLLFHNKNDLALWISHHVYGYTDRLGGENSIDKSKLPGNVDVIELKRKSAGLVGHNYFQSKKGVIKNLFNSLRGKHVDGSDVKEGENKIFAYDFDSGELKEIIA